VRSVVDAIAAAVQRTFGRAIAIVVDGAADAQRWVLPEAESIPIALTINELLNNAVKHSVGAGGIVCALHFDADGVRVVISNPGRLAEGFDLSRLPGGVSGLGLVRALLPRRTATLALEQHGDSVVTTVALRPPSVTYLTTP
jgi:two-component sensor histidine kinase